MSKTYGLTEQDRQRLQRALRFVEDNAHLLRSFRRVRGMPAGGGGGGTSLRTAYCAEDAPDGTVISCWLDYNGQPAKEWNQDYTFHLGQYAEHDGDVYESLKELNQDYEPGEAGSETWWEVVDAGTTAEAYAAGVTYAAGGLCTSGGTAYRSLKDDNIANTPASSPEWWTEITKVDVVCRVANGHRLDFAYPVLTAGQPINIQQKAGQWDAVALFAGAEESCAEGGLLELISHRLTAELSTSSTDMMVADPGYGQGLQFDAKASSDYIIQIDLIYSADASIKIDLSNAAAATISGIFTGHDGGSFAGKVVTEFESAVTFAGGGYIKGELLIKATAAGKISLRFGASANGQECKLLPGSNLQYRRTHYVWVEPE